MLCSPKAKTRQEKGQAGGKAAAGPEGRRGGKGGSVLTSDAGEQKGIGAAPASLCSRRSRQDAALSVESDLHGGAVPWTGRGLKGSQGPQNISIGVGTQSWWDRAMAWAPLLLAVLTHSSGALARLAAPARDPWAQGLCPAARARLCLRNTD